MDVYAIVLLTVLGVVGAIALLIIGIEWVIDWAERQEQLE